ELSDLTPARVITPPRGQLDPRPLRTQHLATRSHSYHVRDTSLASRRCVPRLQARCSGPHQPRRSSRCPRSHGSPDTLAPPHRAPTPSPAATILATSRRIA